MESTRVYLESKFNFRKSICSYREERERVGEGEREGGREGEREGERERGREREREGGREREKKETYISSINTFSSVSLFWRLS